MFRFTIRDVLWLIVVAALGSGWFVERAERNRLSARVAFLEQGADMVIEHIGRENLEAVTVNINGRPWPR